MCTPNILANVRRALLKERAACAMEGKNQILIVATLIARKANEAMVGARRSLRFEAVRRHGSDLCWCVW
jgi:hypothetical protein